MNVMSAEPAELLCRSPKVPKLCAVHMTAQASISPCRLIDRPARLLELPLRAWIELL